MTPRYATAAAFILLFVGMSGMLALAASLDSREPLTADEIYARYRQELKGILTLRQEAHVITTEVATGKVQSDYQNSLILDRGNGSIRALRNGDPNPQTGLVSTFDMLDPDYPVRPRVEGMSRERLNGETIVILNLAFDDFYRVREELRLDATTYRAISSSMTMEVPAPDGRLMHVAFEFIFSDYGVPVPGAP